MNKSFKIVSLILLSFFFAGCSFTINDQIPIKDNTQIKLEEGRLHSAYTSYNISAGESVFIKGVTSNELYFIKQNYFSTTTGNSLDFSIELFESGNDNNSNTELDIYNLNRNYDSNISFIIYSNVTGVNLSNSIQLPMSIRYVGDKKFSDLEVIEEMIILKNNTDYYMKITNNDGGVLSININWLFYE